MRKHLFNTDKIQYARGNRPDVPCILCAINKKNSDVKNLEVYRTDLSVITVNLYPFNPGHLMIFPKRHIESPVDLTDKEALDIHHLFTKSLNILTEEFSPHGYNSGYNIGHGSGASISHIHMHVVPRFKNEIGFLDVLSDTRVVVVDPVEIMERLKKRFLEQ